MIKTMFNGGINGSWDFIVMSAQDAEKFICEPHNRRIAFISITEANGHHIDFHKSYDKIDFLLLNLTTAQLISKVFVLQKNKLLIS